MRQTSRGRFPSVTVEAVASGESAYERVWEGEQRSRDRAADGRHCDKDTWVYHFLIPVTSFNSALCGKSYYVP